MELFNNLFSKKSNVQQDALLIKSKQKELPVDAAALASSTTVAADLTAERVSLIQCEEMEEYILKTVADNLKIGSKGHIIDSKDATTMAVIKRELRARTQETHIILVGRDLEKIQLAAYELLGNSVGEKAERINIVQPHEYCCMIYVKGLSIYCLQTPKAARALQQDLKRIDASATFPLSNIDLDEGMPSLSTYSDNESVWSITDADYENSFSDDDLPPLKRIDAIGFDEDLLSSPTETKDVTLVREALSILSRMQFERDCAISRFVDHLILKMKDCDDINVDMLGIKSGVMPEATMKETEEFFDLLSKESKEETDYARCRELLEKVAKEHLDIKGLSNTEIDNLSDSYVHGVAFAKEERAKEESIHTFSRFIKALIPPEGEVLTVAEMGLRMREAAKMRGSQLEIEEFLNSLSIQHKTQIDYQKIKQLFCICIDARDDPSWNLQQIIMSSNHAIDELSKRYTSQMSKMTRGVSAVFNRL